MLSGMYSTMFTEAGDSSDYFLLSPTLALCLCAWSRGDSTMGLSSFSRFDGF